MRRSEWLVGSIEKGTLNSVPDGSNMVARRAIFTLGQQRTRPSPLPRPEQNSEHPILGAVDVLSAVQYSYRRVVREFSGVVQPRKIQFRVCLSVHIASDSGIPITHPPLMSIFLFLLFFKSICLFLQNLVLRVHVRLFGPNSANRYYSTAYHYLKGNSNNNHNQSHHFNPPVQGNAAAPQARRRRHHHHQHHLQLSNPCVFDDQYYYNLKLNHSRSVVRQQQQIYLQRRNDSSGKGGSAGPSNNGDGGGGINQVSDTHCACVGDIKDDDGDDLQRSGENKNNEQATATATTTTTTSDQSGQLENRIRKRLNKSDLNSPVFE